MNSGCTCVYTCVCFLLCCAAEAGCLEVWSNIGRHHITGRSITMTCGVRRLLSLLLGLGILRLGEKPNNVKQTSTAAVTLTWSVVHHPT